MDPQHRTRNSAVCLGVRVFHRRKENLSIFLFQFTFVLFFSIAGLTTSITSINTEEEAGQRASMEITRNLVRERLSSLSRLHLSDYSSSSYPSSACPPCWWWSSRTGMSARWSSSWSTESRTQRRSHMPWTENRKQKNVNPKHPDLESSKHLKLTPSKWR